MCKRLFLLVCFVLVLSFTGNASASYDITSPGDPVVGIPDDANWPGGEAPPNVIDDNFNTKYLHFSAVTETSGFRVTPSLSGQIVNGLTFTTGNDAPERDPIAFEIYGSNDSINGPYTLIASGDIVDFSQASPWPRQKMNETPVTFDNDVAYDHYQVLFTALRDPGTANSMQITEVELLVVTEPSTRWVYRDIGTANGHAYQIGDTYTIRADGGDIWGNSDGLGYVFRPLNDKGVLEINLQSMDVTDAWTKVGVMIRETLDAGSKHAAMLMTGANGTQMVWRDTTGGGSGGAGTGGEVPPEKMRISREGDVLKGEYLFVTPFISSWVVQSSVGVPMNEDVYIGLAVCSHSGGRLCKAVFNKIPDANWPAYYKAWLPSPSDGAADVPLSGTTLSWMPGDGAESHDVYFGETDPPPFVTNQAGTTIDTGPLVAGVTYKWRIDEVGPGGTVTGNTWSFTAYSPPWGITCEIWTGIGGTVVSDLTGNPRYPDSPDLTFSFNVMDTVVGFGTDDWAGDYGGRMQGLLWPVNSGNYTFWIASDDQSHLYLSSDESPDNLSGPICQVPGWCGYRDYWGEAARQSAPVYLEGDQKYYIRALWKEGGGGDHCEVAWESTDAGVPFGEITSYYFPAQRVSNVGPADGSPWALREIQAYGSLNWSVIRGPTGYNVYFGTDPGAMSLIHAGIPSASCPLPAIGVGTYYWKVDGVDGGNVWPGDVWSFSVSEWVDLEVGGSWGGGSSYDEPSDTWSVTGDGGDIWGTSDSFHYTYQMPVLTRGDVTMTAKITSLPESDYWAKAGLMIRESRAANSKQVMMAATPHCATTQIRSETGADSWSGGENWDHGVPWYVRVVREGDTFTGYRSDNGTDWLNTGTVTVAMADDVLVGMAVTSHNWGALTTAVFEGLSITTPDPRKSWGPDPADEAVGVPIDPVLSWGEGEGVMYNIVYFSDNYDDVVSGAALKAIQPAGNNTYNPGILTLSETYYWCVDELWGEGRDWDVILGDVWSFTVSDVRPVEDYEAYSVLPQAPPPQVDIGIVVEAIPPADQAWVEPQVLVAAVEPDSGCLIAEWAFEDNYDDTSGSGFHGTAVGDATIVVDAERGNVLSLDGDMDYVDCGNPAALNFGTGNWSLSAWVKNTMSGTGDANKGSILANGGDGGGGIRYCLVLTEQQEGEVTLVTDDDDTKAQARGDATKVNDDVWHHVLGVRDGDTIRIYIDGIQEGSAGLPAGYDLSGTSQANVLIGAITKASDSSIYKDYAGLIDEVQIYNCALTDGNARYLAGIGDLLKDGYYGPMIVHYAMDEGSGDVAGDDSLNALDGAIVGASWAGGALDFGGDGDYVVNEDIGPIMNNLNAMSVSLWIQSDVINTDKGFIIFEDPSGADRRGFRYDSSGASGGGDDVIKYGVSTASASEEDESPSNLETTDWQHLIMTWESGVGLKLYVNGIPTAPSYKDTVESGVLSGYTKLLVGKGGKDGAADASWDGRIDDVRVYNYALTENNARFLSGIGHLYAYGPLVASYEFEGNLDDSSGNNKHGTPYGAIGFEIDPVRGQVLDLPGGDNQYVGLPPVGISGAMHRTISCWAKADHTSIPDWTLIFGFTTPGGGDNTHFNIGSLGGPGGVGAHVWGWEATIFSDVEALDWHHYAMTYNGNTVKYYGDGNPVGSVDRGALVTADNVHIGSRITQASSFPGNVDDARIYNYAMTWPEILYLSEYVPTNPMHNTWVDEGEVSSQVEWESPHGGARAMRVDFTGDGKVTRPAPFENWTLGEAKSWVLYFKGDPDNEPEDMYVMLKSNRPSAKDVKLSYQGDISDLKIPYWQVWNISLDELASSSYNEGTEGVPLPHIGKMSLGLSGTGTVYFDDLNLMTTRCVPMYGPLADFTDDCRVDTKDLRVLAGAWLLTDLDNGLWYEYYEQYFPAGLTGTYFDGLTRVSQGAVNNFDISVRHRNDVFGFRFTGLVAAPADGNYTFYTDSDDGSQLFIGDTMVVNNDGWHGMGAPQSGTIYLTAGLHPITVTMFEEGGGEGLVVEVESAELGIPRMPIPDDVLYRSALPVDMLDDGAVNFGDFGVMAEQWRDEQLWP